MANNGPNDARMNRAFSASVSYLPVPGALPQAAMMLRLWRSTHSSRKGEPGEEGDSIRKRADTYDFEEATCSDFEVEHWALNRFYGN